jgi:hypothetical protein
MIEYLALENAVDSDPGFVAKVYHGGVGVGFLKVKVLVVLVDEGLLHVTEVIVHGIQNKSVPLWGKSQVAAEG